MAKSPVATHRYDPLPKVATGIQGLDDITRGGLPRGRPTLLCGGPGCGKTALAMEFISRGARDYGEPGLYVSFEEAAADLITNFAGAQLGLVDSLKAGTIRVESVASGAPDLEAGRFTLDGLLVRLEHWIDEFGAKRLVLDSLDALLSRFSPSAGLRSEVARIIQWTKDRGVTTLLTAERGEGTLTRRGVDEYVVDCVILLDHRVEDQLSKRRLRVIKYRGSGHGADEYPFLITDRGVSVLPITSVGLDSTAPTAFVSSGVAGLDAMLAGEGYYQGSAVLITGGAGTGKSSLSAAFAAGICANGGRALHMAYEESASQLVRNMRSIGVDLESHITSGALRIDPARPSSFGMEDHLMRVLVDVEEFAPDAVVLDPITSFTSIGDPAQVRSMLTRIMDTLKGQGITVVMTSLTPGAGSSRESQTEVSSLVDVWIVMDYRRVEGRRHRMLYVHKARGTGHSDELAELVLSEAGPQVVLSSPMAPPRDP